MNRQPLLLSGGTLIRPGLNPDSPFIIEQSDVLISSDGIISALCRDLSQRAPPSTRTIDCRDKLLTPGLIDTHRHTWQTPLKGRHGDDDLLQFLIRDSMVHSEFSARDVFWGELAGALEAIDAGTTTIVDHANLVSGDNGPELVRAALAPLRAAGTRAIFCPAVARRVRRWSPKLVTEGGIPEWFVPLMREMAGELGNKEKGLLVRLGIAFDEWGVDGEHLRDLFAKVKNLGVELITAHHARGMGQDVDAVTPLSTNGLLSPKILLSHFSTPTPSDLQSLLESQVHISATPSSELLMAGDIAPLFHPSLTPLSSFGIDCHSICSASIVNEMRLALQVVRSAKHPSLPRTTTKEGPPAAAPRTPSVQQAFWIATRGGARAVGLEGVIGGLQAGMRADVVVWDALSPGMAVASQENPVSAVVLNSSIRDVHTVFIDRVVRKEGGRLTPVTIPEEEKWGVKNEVTIDWRGVARELLRTREEVNRRLAGIDFHRVREDILGGRR